MRGKATNREVFEGHAVWQSSMMFHNAYIHIFRYGHTPHELHLEHAAYIFIHTYLKTCTGLEMSVYPRKGRGFSSSMLSGKG